MEECNPGWSSRGDLSLDSRINCLTNYEAVKSLGYLIIIIPSISIILIIRHYIQLAKRLKTVCVLTRQHNRLFPFCFLIMGIASVIYGILKVIYPNEEQPLVGRDISISLMVFIITGSLFSGVVLYLHVIIEFLNGYLCMMTNEVRVRVSKRLNLLGRISWFIPPAVFFCGILPLIATGIPSESEKLGRAHLIGFSVSSLCYTMILCNCLSLLIQELRVYINSAPDYYSSDVKLVALRLNTAYYWIAGLGSVFGLLLLLFGCSSFLFNLTTYFLLIAYTCVSPGSYALVMTVARLYTPEFRRVVPILHDLTTQKSNDSIMTNAIFLQKQKSSIQKLRS